MASAREIALETLLLVDGENSYSNLALQKMFRKYSLSAQDRHFITQLVYGTIQLRRILDEALKPFLKQPVAKLKPWVRELLRISAYQLLFLERVPPFAVIHEAVTIAGKRASSLRGFVNAVLRNITRSDKMAEGRKLLDVSGVTSIEEVAIRTSHPTWMIQEWCSEYGLETAKSIAVSNNERPFLTLRVNVGKMDVEQILAVCQREGILAEKSPVSPVGIRLTEGIDIAKWKWFQEGYVTVQDESAMLVAPVLAPKPHERILDACAAPGGKTTHIAELVHDEADIIANDLHEHKIQLISGAAKRLGLQSIRASVRDMSAPVGDDPGFDRILLDAPCSGMGVIRRKPDLKWRKAQEELVELPLIQENILHTCWNLLRPAGVLVYSTCTIRSAENQAVIEKFCATHPDARIDEVAQFLPAQAAGNVLTDKLGVTILPTHFSSDGFFISRLSKM